MTGRRLSLAMN